MIGTVIKADVREAWRDGRLPILLVLSVLLALAAAWTGVQRISAYEGERTAVIQQERAAWDAQGSENPHTVAHFGNYGFKPLTKLATFDPGLTPYLGSMIWMEAHWQVPAAARAAEDAPEAQRFADLTPAWLLQVVAPLAIALLGFPLLARERETGRWRSVAAAGVSTPAFLSAKALSLACLSLIALSPLLAAAVLGPALSGAVMPADGLARSAGMFAVYAAFLIAFMALTLCVSAWSGTSNRALAALVGIWVLSVLVVPKLGANFADLALPVPSAATFRAEMERDVREGFGDYGPEAERIAAFDQGLLEQYGITDLADLPVDYDGLRLQESEDFNALVLDRHFGRLYDAYHRQRQPLRALAVVSPVLAVREASAFLAGVDEQHHRHFADAAEHHRREMIRVLNADQTEHGEGLGFDYMAPPETWAAVPEFAYAPPTMGQTAGSAGLFIASLILAFWIAVAAFLATRGVRRWSQV